MAINQGIRITFLENASEGDRITFYGIINGLNIVYNNGLNVVDFEFTNNDSEILADPLHRVKIGATAEITANNLKLFLDTNGYESNSIPINNFVILGSPTPLWNVESLYTYDSNIKFIIDASASERVSIVAFSNKPVPTTAPKYFFQYENLVNDRFLCQIYQKDFTGNAKEITGRATINKGSIKEHFDSIRGTGLSLSLEASEDLQFQDLYSDNERDFTVKFYMNDNMLFSGYLKPDGIFQSFTRSIWNINIECVDGLGFLSELSFVDENGYRFTGKLSALEIIRNCLARTGLKNSLSTYVPIFYRGIIDENINTDVLAEMYLSTDRFIKSDDNTIDNCESVLKSVLGLFNAVITSQGDTWFIFRPSEFYKNINPQFKLYNPNGTYQGIFGGIIKSKIGSQIDNFYPHHCSGNQQIEIKGAVSAFRLGYKYGFISSILGNGNLNHQAGTKIYDGWNVRTWTETFNSGKIVIDPVSTIGISFESGVNTGGPAELRTAIESTEIVPVYEGYSFEFKSRVISYGYPVAFTFIITVGDYSLMSDGSWYFSTTGSVSIILINADQGVFPESKADNIFERTFSIKTDPLPPGASGNIKITMNVPRNNVNNEPVLVEVKSIELINTFQGENIVGEFHTVSRNKAVSSIVKGNRSVLNGDSTSNFYTGAIYMQDKETLTKYWHRGKFPDETFFEMKPLLRIAAEDELRISQIPTKIFSGDIYGYLHYLSVYEINNVPGKFMPIEWSFNTFSNITTAKGLEIFSPELYDIDYLKTDDYGETVKPTITS